MYRRKSSTDHRTHRPQSPGRPGPHDGSGLPDPDPLKSLPQRLVSGLIRGLKHLWSAAAAEALAAPVAIWGSWQEKSILRRGRLLDPTELHFCQQIGIQHPERIRVLAVPQVPMPVPGFILRLGEIFKIGTQNPAGMTLGQGIFALPACAHHLPLIRHELVHVRQYQQLGGIWRFLRRYLRECLYHGYVDSPMEQEAREVSSDSGRD